MAVRNLFVCPVTLLLMFAKGVFSLDDVNCSSIDPSAFAPITLTAGNLNLEFVPFGGTVQSVHVMDSSGSNSYDITLGFDDAKQYCSNTEHPYFGAIIGRVANRIAKGEFQLNGKTYHTPINEPAPEGGNDTLHGGFVGVDRRVWTVTKNGTNAATLRLESADGDQGFPGQLDLAVTYTLLETDADDAGADGAGGAAAAATTTTWWIDYEAKLPANSDVDTVVSLTQHTYWNLNGAQATVLEHELQLPGATSFLAVDDHLLPTGTFTEVSSAPWMDFTEAKTVGADLAQTANDGGGYDNAFVFSSWDGAPARLLASVRSPLTGVNLQVLSDQPSLQVYSGGQLDGTLERKQDQNPPLSPFAKTAKAKQRLRSNASAPAPPLPSSPPSSFSSLAAPSLLESRATGKRRARTLAKAKARAGSQGSYYDQFFGLALEAQHFPDSVHHQLDGAWPSVVLRPGETYRQRTGYRFWVDE